MCQPLQALDTITLSQNVIKNLQWDEFIGELKERAPTLFKLLSKITSHSDKRNEKKRGSAHFPGICMAASIILKERNREMCGVQGVMSLLLFASRADKVVCA